MKKRYLFLISPIIICLIVFFIILAIVITVLLPQIFLFAIMAGSESPAKPQITYAEFPFTVEYSIDGEIYKVEDVVICKYDGIGIGSNGKFLKWKKYVGSTGEENLLLLTDGNKKVYCTVGEAIDYGGETKEIEKQAPVVYIEEYIDTAIHSSGDPLKLEKYNIQIINYKFSDPIENTFK